MDFSISGSDSWDTTAHQENFIESYFQKEKFPISSPVGNTLKKKKKGVQDGNLTKDNPNPQPHPKKKKHLKRQIEAISSQSIRINSGLKTACSKKNKALKQPVKETIFIGDDSVSDSDKEMNCSEEESVRDSESIVNNSLQSIRIDSGLKTARSKKKKVLKQPVKETIYVGDDSVSDSDKEMDSSKESAQDYESIVNNSLLKTKNLDNSSPDHSIRKKQKPKKKSTISGEGDLLEENSHPKKEKVSKKKKVKKGSKDSSLELIETEESIKNSNVSDSDEEELKEEIRNSDIFREIKDFMKQAPFLDNLTGSDDNFSEQSDEDSKDSSSEETYSVPPKKKVKVTENLNDSTDIFVKSSQNLFPKSNPCNAGEEKCIVDKTSNVNRNFTEKAKVSTSLRSKAWEKLKSAKFRYLNEKLYTETGGNAFHYFQKNVDEFHDYHQGYNLQVSKWPMNPVSKIISDLQNLSKNTVIADLGCGDAKIAQTLTNMTVYSFDIIALNEFVTACDISKVPLPSNSVDVVVFCLSLMGVNFKDYLCEAHRILKMGGILKVAEVESRIVDVNDFINGLKCIGFTLENQDLKHKIFVFLDLKKAKVKVKKGKIPKITLRPCLYKKR